MCICVCVCMHAHACTHVCVCVYIKLNLVFTHVWAWVIMGGQRAMDWKWWRRDFCVWAEGEPGLRRTARLPPCRFVQVRIQGLSPIEGAAAGGSCRNQWGPGCRSHFSLWCTCLSWWNSVAWMWPGPQGQCWLGPLVGSHHVLSMLLTSWNISYTTDGKLSPTNMTSFWAWVSAFLRVTLGTS